PRARRHRAAQGLHPPGRSRRRRDLAAQARDSVRALRHRPRQRRRADARHRRDLRRLARAGSAGRFRRAVDRHARGLSVARRPDHADISDVLVAAIERAKTSAWAEAAALVIAAWRRAPSARLAALLTAIEKPLPPPTSLRGDTVAEREDYWHALADTKDDQFLESLLHEQWPVHPKGAKARVRKLEAWPR